MVNAEPRPELVENLTSEIIRLNDQQVEALQRAAFGGMTGDETREYDMRADLIAELVKKLSTITRRAA
jgi:hypothetical protein